MSLLVTYGTIGISSLARPIGAIFLGAYGDRHGRKNALTLSIALMTAGTGPMTLMPSYDTLVSGMALSYNISVPIFGGFAPFAAQSLIELTGSKLAPSYYLMATALLSLAALIALRGRLGV